MSKSRRIHIKSITHPSINSDPSTSSSSSKPTMNSHYAIGTSGGAVKRIRTPLKHDVLCGRGGGINSHPGNQNFRDFVKERKNAYNLAQNKAEKARVAREVVDMVKNLNPPGRFLERESDSTSSSGWWIECSLAKALSKTSQALREGAPSIRAAHQQVPEPTLSARTSGISTRKAKMTTPATHQVVAPAQVQPDAVPQSASLEFQLNAATPQLVQEILNVHADSDAQDPENVVLAFSPLVPHHEHEISYERPSKKIKLENRDEIETVNKTAEMTANDRSAPMLAPLLSNQEFEELYGRVSMTGRLEPTPEFVNAPTPPPEVTPPLMPLQAPETPVSLTSLPPQMLTTFPAPLPRRPSEVRLQRSHSLALSDVSSDFGYNEFVNPFEDESFIDHLWGQPTDANLVPRQNSISTSNTDRKRSFSQASFTELSDLGDSAFTKYQESDFNEGMKMVHDAAHPGLSSPNSDESIPTHLIPYRGGLGPSRWLSSAPPFPSRSPMQYAGSQ